MHKCIYSVVVLYLLYNSMDLIVVKLYLVSEALQVTKTI